MGEGRINGLGTGIYRQKERRPAQHDQPIDLLARIAELERLESKLMEYRDVEEADA